MHKNLSVLPLLPLVCDISIKPMAKIVFNKVASEALYLPLCHSNIYLLFFAARDLNQKS